MKRFAQHTTIAALLSLGAVTACNCETETFVPGARYTPDRVLDFGKVSVTSEKTLNIKVDSVGGAALKILAANFENASDTPGKTPKWRVKVPDALAKGLTPGRTSSISVTYRPCPQAWVNGTADNPGNTLDSMFDFTTCPGSADSVDLVTVEEKTRTGGQRITVSGQPVQPPSASVKCTSNMESCNKPMAQLLPCNAMSFGNVSTDDPPCELIVEVHDSNRGDKPVGDLNVERIEITAQNINELPNGTTHSGEELGFSVLDGTGMPLMPTSSSPFVVSIEEGKTDGSKQFRIRFNGSKTGDWFGSDQFGMTGVRLYTNDPSNRIVHFNISGSGSAPDIQVFPKQLAFGPVQQGTTKTLTATVTNAGNAVLKINSLTFMQDSGMTKFHVMTSKGMPPFTVMPNEMFAMRVSYSPNTSGMDADTLLIGCNDVSVMGVVKIPVTGGAVPKLQLSPPDTLVFPTTNPPSSMPRCETLNAANIGYGDLKIQRVEIVGAGGMVTPSVMDFVIQECTSTPQSCDPNLTLCPPSMGTCANAQTTFHVCYQNHDISETDYAELRVHSNDPTDPIHTIVLEAHDVPCFPPNPIITVGTTRPCKGMPVMVDGMMSTPGGIMGGMPSITMYNWGFSFTPPPTPVIMPNGVVSTSFTPQTAGIYILTLDVTNNCGQMSQSSASETISVAENCN
jgi:HYDIN/CFA65/VesB family protein